MSEAFFFAKERGSFHFRLRNNGESLTQKRILILYYSHTQQTRLLMKSFTQGLARPGVDVLVQQLEPVQAYDMPFRSNWKLIAAMVETFFCRQMAIKPLPAQCFEPYDLIILAGPTWSYQPSGPMLSLLTTYGDRLCSEKPILPVISCRSYWRIHFWQVKKRLNQAGMQVAEPIVFCHPIREPYRIIGLLLQLRGKMVMRKDSWFRKHYPGYGHSREQLTDAVARGREIGDRLLRADDQP